jgi:hypothetical protein
MDLETKNMLLKIQHEIELLKDFVIPNEISLSSLAEILCVKSETLRKYVNRNLLEGRDYFKKNGRIYIAKVSAMKIKEKYNAKRLLH